MKLKNHKLVIYIPSFNRYEKLKSQLEILQCQIKDYDNIKIIVSDNCSTDSRYISLPNDYPNITYKRNPVNLGIVANIIQGFSTDDGDYLWILSDDEKVSSNAISKIVSAIKGSPDHIYLKAKIKGEQSLVGKTNILSTLEVLQLFSGASMTGLISANIYCIKTYGPYIEAGYNYGHTLFPHSAIFYNYLSNNDKINLIILDNCVEWHFGEITYQKIHDQCWRYFLDFSDLFSGQKRQIFVSKFLADWGVGHYLNILAKNKDQMRYWYYATRNIRNLPYFVKVFWLHYMDKIITMLRAGFQRVKGWIQWSA